MKKLFISQPMRGKSDEDILEERKKAIKSAEKAIGEPVEVIDSFFQEAPADAKPLWFLGKSLELLAGADIAYFAEELSILVLLNITLIESNRRKAVIQISPFKAHGYVPYFYGNTCLKRGN